MRVLLVEDNPKDRELLVAALKARGAQPVAAASDDEAYRALQDPRPFDILITDVDLGHGTTGFDVARAARRVQPRTPVVYITGHSFDGSFHQVADSVILRKGSSMKALVDTALVAANVVGANGEGPSA